MRSQPIINVFLICKNVLWPRPVLCHTHVKQYLTPREFPLKNLNDFQSRGSTIHDWKTESTQEFGAFLELLFFTFTWKFLRLICPDLYPSRCLTWVVCYDNKETYCCQCDARVHHMNPVSWSRPKKKKKSMALSIKSIEDVQLYWYTLEGKFWVMWLT